MEYGILKARIVDKFTGEIIVSQQTPTDTLPDSIELEFAWLTNNLSNNGYAYDTSICKTIFNFNSEDCEVTDLDGNAIEEKMIEWTNSNGTYDSTMNMKKVNANTMKFYLTQEEPEMMITFYVTPQSGTADIMADCSDGSIKWKEKHSHTVEWEDLTGTRHTANCKHTIEYEAHLTDITCNITPETFKSGYGFDLELSYGLSKVSITDKGGSSSHCDGGVDKDPEEKVSIADVAVFAFPDESYTVAVGRKEQYIQPYSFYLEVTENTGNRIKLQPPISEISVTGERKIFTPVSIAGTADKPVTHYATIQIRGGGVTDVEFCYTLSVPFTINGNMYEDGLTM